LLDLPHGAQQDCAAKSRLWALTLGPERFADLFANPSDISQVEIAVGLARCSDANERQAVSRIAWLGSLLTRSGPALTVAAMISPTSVSNDGTLPGAPEPKLAISQARLSLADYVQTMSSGKHKLV
jgi:hypothetical protein